ncbi:MAG TPA: hypothetical protein VHE57_10200 [Mycobacteriales bacterium]|nr:hypothetical protein [Mycobacteriales bacterium]
MQRPRSLTVTAALVAAQAAALGTYGAVLLVRAFVGHPSHRDDAVWLGIVFLACAAGVVTAAVGLWRMRRWAQAPTYLVQFFSIVIGMGQVAHLPALMVPLIALGLGTLVAVSLQPSRDALGGI